jgi:putative tricarboxylic transport membrane protein
MEHPIFDGIVTLFTSGWALFYAVLGTAIGLIAGATPGLTASAAISMIIPLTFYLEPMAALIFVYTIGKASSFGGSIPAILFNTPGTPQASATQLEGYPLTQQGKQGKALKMAVIASALGDTFSELLLIFGAAFIAVYTVRMGPPEIFSVFCCAFVIIGSVIGKSVVKGLISTLLGILLAMVGLDPITGMPRYDFGFAYLQGGIGLVPLLLGVFVASEVFVQIANRGALGAERMLSKRSDRAEDNRVTWPEFRRCLPIMAKSTGMGTIIGMLPGVGASAACFVAYAEAKRSSKTPEKWGKGAIEGVAAAEAANNSVSGANLIPLLTLGIPGSVLAALLGGVFLIHGMQIGPKVFVESRDIIYGLFASGLLCIGVYFLMGYFGSTIIGRIIALMPVRAIYPFIFITSIIAVYALRNTLFDVAAMLVFGVVGYFLKRFDYSLPAFIIAFILGPGAEESLRQSLMLSADGWGIFLDRPVAIIFILIAVSIVGLRLYQSIRANNGASQPEMAD